MATGFDVRDLGPASLARALALNNRFAIETSSHTLESFTTLIARSSYARIGSTHAPDGHGSTIKPIWAWLRGLMPRRR